MLRARRPFADRAADAYRPGDGRDAVARIRDARSAARVARHHRFGRPVRRPVRNRRRYHDLVPGDRRFEVDQPRGRGARYRRSAACHGHRPSRRYPGGYRLQQVLRRRRQDHGAHGRLSPTSSPPSFRARSTRSCSRRARPRSKAKDGVRHGYGSRRIKGSGGGRRRRGGAARPS